MKPKNLLIYYGYPNAFNSADNSWDNKKVAEDMSKYSIIVFGDGLQEDTHADHANMNTIIGKIRDMNPNVKIFGYVTVNQTFANFKSKVDDWSNNVDTDGIFLDEAGYDYGTAATNGRTAFNQKIDYIHSNDMVCFVNAWKIIHVLGTENDTSYANTTYNPDLVESNLDSNDIYLLESLAVNTLSYTNDFEAKADWKSRLDKAVDYRKTYNIQLAGICVIDNDLTGGQGHFNFAYISALMGVLDVFGSSDESYASTSAAVKFWDRPDVTELEDLEKDSIVLHNSDVDTDVYYRVLKHGRLKLDFSSGNEESELKVY